MLELRGAALLILDNVVVIRPIERTLAREPLDERREIEVGPAAGFLQGVIKITAVDKDSDALAALAPRAEFINRGRACVVSDRRAPPSV